MKTSMILCKADRSNNIETPKHRSGAKLFTSVILIVLLSGMMLLSSCFVEGPEPRMHHPRHAVVIVEHRDNGGHHDNDEHHDRDHHDER